MREPGGDGIDERTVTISPARRTTRPVPPLVHVRSSSITVRFPLRARPISSRASRSAVFLAMSCRLSAFFLPFATPSSTFAMPPLK